MSISEKLTIIAENVPKVYDSGYATGSYEGKLEQYNMFWDGFQQNGTRTNYEYAFAHGFPVGDFPPKYSMQPTSANSMFECSGSGNLAQSLKDKGITLDTSNCTKLGNTFFHTGITHLPTIDVSQAVQLSFTFASENIVEIEKIIMSENNINSYTFHYTSNLEKMIIEGTIGRGNFSFAHAKKLSKESIVSIINALSSSTSGLNVTVSLTAVNKAFESASGKADGSTSSEWTSLVASKSNWTIALADA